MLFLSCQCCDPDPSNSIDITRRDPPVGVPMDILQVPFHEGNEGIHAVEERATYKDTIVPADNMRAPRRSSKNFYHFSASIDRSTGKKMGIAVKQDPESGALQVMKVERGESAVDEWNATHPEERVKEGDYITHVNEICDIAEVVNECLEMKVLHVGFKRLVGVSRSS